MENIIPSFADVVTASERLQGWIIATPVLESEALNERLGLRLLLKAECLQHAGSFKIRGALNRMLRLSHAERRNGVVAYSSGNHAQAVALAARWLGVPAIVVMPADAPLTKREQARRFGAELVLYDRRHGDRERIAAEIAEARAAVLVPPFDHADVIAGQGTVGLELAAAADARKVVLGDVYVACSGGGLIAGCGLALRSAFPECRLHAVEPVGYDDMARSLATGTRCFASASTASLCDGLLAAAPGAIPFALCKQLVYGAHTVEDAEVLAAMETAARYFKIVVEPSGAAALAAALRARPRDRDAVGVVVSGGNVDRDLLVRALATSAE